MASLFGQTYTRAQLLAHAGDIEQVAGVRVGELSDGFERGVRVADVHTGSGFEFTVLIDRGLDIGAARLNGASLAFRSPAPPAAPAFYEPEGNGWLRGFSGGLATTGGLTYFGAAGVDEGRPLGLHGRASYIPAQRVACGGAWQGDEYELSVTGQLHEVAMYGENLLLERRITARLGESRLFIEDVVANQGFEPTPHMMLYHCNFGFPLLTQATELLYSSRQVEARDADAQPGLGEFMRFQPPTAGYREQVFYHTPKPDAAGFAQIGLANRAFGGGKGLGAYVRFRPDELPCLVQWKQMGQGIYVCGLEPGTNWVGGRGAERAAGRLRLLEPGESRRYQVEIGALASQAEIDAFVAAMP